MPDALLTQDREILNPQPLDKDKVRAKCELLEHIGGGAHAGVVHYVGVDTDVPRQCQ